MTLDMQDVLLEATAEVQEIVREIMQELTEPMMMAQLKQAWGSLPEEMKEKYQREKPQEYAALMQVMERER